MVPVGAEVAGGRTGLRTRPGMGTRGKDRLAPGGAASAEMGEKHEER